MLITTHKSCDTLDPAIGTAIYLAQSGGDSSLFRVGESLNILSRRNTHRRGPPTNCKEPPNWTEVFRPWTFIWIAQATPATRVGLRMAEGQLMATFAKQFAVVDRSGFRAPPTDVEALIAIAQREVPYLSTIIDRQRGEFFDKRRYWAERTMQFP